MRGPLLPLLGLLGLLGLLAAGSAQAADPSEQAGAGQAGAGQGGVGQSGAGQGAEGWRLGALNLSGSLRGGLWSSDRTLDDRQGFAPASLWLKAAPSFGGGWYAGAEGWLLREQPLDGDGHTPGGSTGGRPVRGELREGFLGWRNDSVEITRGRRIIAWGRADRVNPTDVVSSRDYTRLFVEDDDQRRGSVVATAAYALGDLTATALWLPEFRPDIYPIPHLSGVTVRQGADRFAADQGALRLERIGGGFDWSVSYFNGLNRNPGARLAGPGLGIQGLGGLSVAAVYNRVQTWGADIATNIGAYGLRGEIAYSQPGHGDGDIFNPHSFVEAVGGIDRNFSGHFGAWNVNLQYVLREVVGYVDPAAGGNPVARALAVQAALVNNQRLRVQHGPTLRIGTTMLNDTLLLEIAAAAFVSDGGFVIRPRATYLVSDGVKIILGADIFSGAADSYFGQLRRNTTFLSEIRYTF